MELKRVVVTGLGAVPPVGNTPEATWESILAGKSGAAPITHFDTTLFKTKFACEVKGLNLSLIHISSAVRAMCSRPKKVKITCRTWPSA